MRPKAKRAPATRVARWRKGGREALVDSREKRRRRERRRMVGVQYSEERGRSNLEEEEEEGRREGCGCWPR
jgi:hypothetical protein